MQKKVQTQRAPEQRAVITQSQTTIVCENTVRNNFNTLQAMDSTQDQININNLKTEADDVAKDKLQLHFVFE